MDGVFHHVGRDFWAFRDILEKGRDSRFIDWFRLDFNGRSPFNDPFSTKAGTTAMTWSNSTSTIRRCGVTFLRQWPAGFVITIWTGSASTRLITSTWTSCAISELVPASEAGLLAHGARW